MDCCIFDGKLVELGEFTGLYFCYVFWLQKAVKEELFIFAFCSLNIYHSIYHQTNVMYSDTAGFDNTTTYLSIIYISNTLWYSRFCPCAINTGLSIVQNRNIDEKSVKKK